jgi:orotidine-5'-phosphate decarboxylase
MTPEEAAKKIILAIDVSWDTEVRRIAQEIGTHVGLVKVGLQAFCANGPGIVRDVRHFGCGVMLDLKLNDIPNTVAEAMAAIVPHGVALTTMHVDAGPDAMTAVVAARDAAHAKHPNRDTLPKTKIVGITVLTSLRHADLIRTGTQPELALHLGPQDVLVDVVSKKESAAVRELVLRRARLAKECGLDGIVCSPQEISAVREACGKDFLVITPGVRPAWAAVNDQKRVMTPSEAVQAGSDYLVIGRPILQPPPDVGTPEDAVKRIVKELCGKDEVTHAA